MWIFHNVINFLGLGGLVDLVNVQQFSLTTFATLAGIEALISPIAPIILVLEVGLLFWLNRRATFRISRHYKIPLMMYAANAVIPVYLTLKFFILTFNFFSKFALFQVESRLIYFLYAFLIWEFSHFVFHYSCHKVRLLWILHSPHHAPAQINLSLIYTAFFLHGLYATLVRTAICAILGVPLQLLIFVLIIDGCWGTLIHISEEIWHKGKPSGILGHIFLWPSDHRVHHANNPQYIDKNYCNTLPVWDKLFKTLQREIPEIKPQYGLARDVDQDSFVDTYFGEILLLFKDLKNAGSVKNALLYLLMPPGWKPKTGNLVNPSEAIS
ncbi:sterol desaturase family protein [Solimicrobium silvestre]|uniref:Fatty acid hydroxylase superfamily n=1 Tax=Solimicrobium silvestre TaxID=2099400 RepID=A0A2S9H1X9_9BURK|nr:sterol desaturase family protein [Solimicrobium silvestre]PRC93960.1 Fatty acid hydroxylase superfamily [Solimicrobium silvestre]